MPPVPTSLSTGSLGLTPVEFPHSDTHGSTLVWQLTVLFRGLHRPSSPACPKASTSRPESLINLILPFPVTSVAYTSLQYKSPPSQVLADDPDFSFRLRRLLNISTSRLALTRKPICLYIQCHKKNVFLTFTRYFLELPFTTFMR
jgi:hypothetical protein